MSKKGERHTTQKGRADCGRQPSHRYRARLPHEQRQKLSKNGKCRKEQCAACGDRGQEVHIGREVAVGLQHCDECQRRCRNKQSPHGVGPSVLLPEDHWETYCQEHRGKDSDPDTNQPSPYQVYDRDGGDAEEYRRQPDRHQCDAEDLDDNTQHEVVEQHVAAIAADARVSAGHRESKTARFVLRQGPAGECMET